MLMVASLGTLASLGCLWLEKIFSEVHIVQITCAMFFMSKML